MNDKIELKKIITDFQKYSNNLICTSNDDATVNLKRFKKNIDENSTIHNIIFDKIGSSNYSYNECFFTEHNDWKEISIPEDESDHIKAIYDFITHIIESNIAVFNVASLYYCSSRNLDDIVQNFIKIAILPLIDYVNIELSKKLLEYDDFYPNVTFAGNNSPVYFQSVGNQRVSYTNNELENINNLIGDIIRLVDELDDIKEINKDSLKDDVVIIQETINSEKPNSSRMKRIIEGLTKNIAVVSTSVSSVAVIADKLNELWQLIQSYFG